MAVVKNSAALPAVLPGGSTEGHRGWSCERRRDAQGEFYPWIVKSTGVTSSTSTLSAPTFGQFPAAEPRCDGPVPARGRAVTVLFPNAPTAASSSPAQRGRAVGFGCVPLAGATSAPLGIADVCSR